MKFWKITCIVLGSFFLVIALMVTLRMNMDADQDTAYKIGFITGHLFSFLPALIFFFLAYRLNKKIKKKKLNKITDSFLTNE